MTVYGTLTLPKVHVLLLFSVSHFHALETTQRLYKQHKRGESKEVTSACQSFAVCVQTPDGAGWFAYTVDAVITPPHPLPW